jgi:hypothetical protein
MPQLRAPQLTVDSLQTVKAVAAMQLNTQLNDLHLCVIPSSQLLPTQTLLKRRTKNAE